ncbi:hypothetical protein SEUCBS139899_009901 [Sporothrix eucalyptigena]|uniref:Uncharacterized protein n=1 Tax=Sporothrix eucalyptigena TaxID=1812306 RepID=A0ABP0CYM9_9PEZI
MAPKAPIGKAGLNERELSTLAAAFASLRGDQTVDWVKFSHLAGYASTNSARVCFRPLQKKLEAFVEGICKDGFDTAANATNTSANTASSKSARGPKASGGKPRGRPKKRKLETDEKTAQKPQGSLCASHDTDVEGDIKPVIEEKHDSELGCPMAAPELLGAQDDKAEVGSTVATAQIGKLILS